MRGLASGVALGCLLLAASATAASDATVRRCPSTAAVAKLLDVKLASSQTFGLACAYSPPAPSLKEGVGLSWPGETLGDQWHHARFGGSTAPVLTQHTKDGTITTTLRKAQFGPGSFRTTTLIRTVTGITQVACIDWLLDNMSRTVMVEMQATRGPGSTYRGSVSLSEMCRIADRVVALGG